MSRIRQAMALVEAEITKREACCAIYDDTCCSESTLGGTRDGYLNVIRALLKLIEDFDKSEGNSHWDNEIKTCLHDLVGQYSVWIVGAEVFASHADFIARMKGFYRSEPEVLNAIECDPQFAEPKS